MEWNTSAGDGHATQPGGLPPPTSEVADDSGGSDTRWTSPPVIGYDVWDAMPDYIRMLSADQLRGMIDKQLHIEGQQARSQGDSETDLQDECTRTPPTTVTNLLEPPVAPSRQDREKDLSDLGQSVLHPLHLFQTPQTPHSTRKAHHCQHHQRPVTPQSKHCGSLQIPTICHIRCEIWGSSEQFQRRHLQRCTWDKSQQRQPAVLPP